MADKKISELDLALLINNDAEFPFSQDNAGEPTTFKGRITQLGTKIAEDMTFSNLRTTSKKLVGAINELLSLGSPIIIGTTAPTSSQGEDGNIYVQYTEGTGGADDEVDGIFVKIDGAWCEISTGGGSGTTDYEDLSNKPQVNSVELVGNKSLDDLGIMPASLSKTVSGSIVHITDGADNIPVKSLVSQIVAVESGNGQPKSPDNPYTISGFDSGVVSVCGVNVWDEEWEAGLYNSSDGTPFASNSYIRSKSSNYISVIPNTNYYIYSPKTIRIFEYDNNYQYIKYADRLNNYLTSSDNCRYIRFCVYDSSYGATYNHDISINYPSTDTQYHAYNGNTYTFTFGQTVYGGHFDNKGNLVVTKAIINLGSLDWTYHAPSGDVGAFFDAFLPSNSIIGNRDIAFDGNIGIYNIIPSKDIALSGYDNNVCALANATRRFITCDQRFTDANSYKNAMNGVILGYPLANPITLEITTQDIPTLLGENNIYSNCGDVEVNYYISNSDDIVDLIESVGKGVPAHHYSEDEQVVGTWIDGSTIYERVFDLGSDITISYNSWSLTTISLSSINRLVNIRGLNSDGNAFYGDLLGGNNNGYLQLQTTRNGQDVYVQYVVVEYTKSST